MQNNKILFTALLLTATFFILPVKAQVTIGSTVKPNPNSLLDLKESSDNYSTKGLVLPRVKLQSADNPAPLQGHVKGMFVYNTEDYGSGVTAVTEGVYYNDGTKWIAVTALATVTRNNTTSAVTATHGGTFTVIDGVTTDAQGRITAVNTITITLPAESNDWHTTGNAGTAPATNFLGTTDAQPLVIRVANTRAGYISNLTTGANYNTIGLNALAKNTGAGNNAFGLNALAENTTGGGNNAFGRDALTANTIGTYNSAFGNQALYSNIIGIDNSAFGYQALYANTASSNSAFGYAALQLNESGANNSAFGLSAMRLNKSGNYNSAVGTGALHDNESGNYNSAVGVSALYSNTEGGANSAVGYSSLYSNTIGNQNSAVGLSALYFNTEGNGNVAVGYRTGYNLITGSYNVAIGYNVQALATNSTYTITIGTNGDTPSTTANTRVFAPAWTYSSDRKWKHDIKPATQGLNFVMKLKPSEFIFNGDESNTKVLGFIAQDVQETMREEGMATGYGMVSQMTEDRLGLATTELIPVLTKAIQEQQAVIETQQQTIDLQKQAIDALLRRVEALEQKGKR